MTKHIIYCDLFTKTYYLRTDLSVCINLSIYTHSTGLIDINPFP